MIIRLLLLSSALILNRAQLAHGQTEWSHWSVKKLIEHHQQLHPVLKVQDVFKLIYEASLGVGHILSDSSAVASYVMSELASVDTAIPGEPLIERISLENEMVRINLRPFRALNLAPSALVKVMFQSASETIPDTIMFYRQWNEFSALVRYGILKFPPDDVKTWEAKVDSGRIGLVHHSPEYVKTSRPAYRVIRLNIFEATFGKMKE